MDALGPFIMGANALGFLVAALFFLRFWRRTRDLLFAAFSVAFFLMATNQALVALSGIPREEQAAIYLLRLAAFSLLIVAIVGKNLRARRTTPQK
jgi:hypothetical protein